MTDNKFPNWMMIVWGLLAGGGGIACFVIGSRIQGMISNVLYVVGIFLFYLAYTYLSYLWKKDKW